MNRKIGIWAAFLVAAVLMTSAASAQSLNLANSDSFNNHNFAIAKYTINGTIGTQNALQFATVEEPLVIFDNNQTIAVSLRDWGVDSSRAGVILSVSNGTGPGSIEYLVPLQRYGWGSQIDEVSFGNLKIRVGLTGVFRGRTAEWAKFCVTATKLPTK